MRAVIAAFKREFGREWWAMMIATVAWFGAGLILWVVLMLYVVLPYAPPVHP